VALVAEAASVQEARSVARSPGARDLAMVEVVDADGWVLVGELRRVGWASVVVLPVVIDVTLVSGALSHGVSAVLFPVSGRTAPLPAGTGSPAPGISAVGVRTDARPVPDVLGVPQLLTHRELQILQFAADGLANSDIADRLGISPLTIKSHLGRIARRLGSGERAQMVLLALRAGVIA
jgi:DNA-binding CsgD family transcriptional regulator